MAASAGGARQQLRTVLGLLWLLDGLLQLQPVMWSRSFGSETLASAGAGQPLAIGAPVRLFAGLVADHPVGFNVVFASAQLVIGAGLLLARDPRRLRVVCGASVAWALGIWVVGEGLGGLFGGHTSLSVGAPGAALLYLVLTVAAWPLDRPLDRWLPAVWTAVWLCGALLQLLPAQRGGVGLGDQLEMGSMMSPRLLAGPELQVALWLATLPAVLAALVSGGLVAGQAWIGIAVLRRGSRRIALRVGAGLAIVFWVACQGFGGLSTGSATDPGSAPLLVLLAFAVAAVPVEHRETSARQPTRPDRDLAVTSSERSSRPLTSVARTGAVRR
ncbi:MAG: hypothetical protein QOJ32_619 [Frankiaceae bacterium]|nr:hypothetical protein [Frankiaceae bacterium]